LAYAGILALTALVSAWIAEGVFRYLGDSASIDLGGLYTPFGNRSYKVAPNVDTEAKWSAGEFSVHADSLGLRCDAARKYGTKSGQPVDVIFMGDSQGFGNGVNYEDTIAGAVAIKASARGERVVNCAVGGHSMRNQEELVSWLRKQEVKAREAYVVLLTPVLSLYAATYTHAEVGPDGRLYGKKYKTLGRMIVWFKTHAVIYARLRDALHNSGLVPPAQDLPQVIQMYCAGAPTDEARTNLVAVLTKIQAAAKEDGAKLLLAYVPLSSELDFDTLTKAADPMGIELNRDRPLKVCETVAAQLNASLCNLRPVLAGLHDKGERLSLRGDPHYAPATSVACADALWPQLEQLIDKH